MVRRKLLELSHTQETKKKKKKKERTLDGTGSDTILQSNTNLIFYNLF